MASAGWTAITVGEDFSCGLRGGNAFCWGRNDKGQIGDGTTRDQSSPTAVSGGLSFTQIDAGDRHICGIISNGTAYCWGQNNDGELGDGTTSDRQGPDRSPGRPNVHPRKCGGTAHAGRGPERCGLRMGSRCQWAIGHRNRREQTLPGSGGRAVGGTGTGNGER